MSSTVQGDFDRIAGLAESRFDHNSYYHEMLLRSLGEAPIREALDLGCGTGQFTRLLAKRAGHMVGLDFSANMIAAARERSAGLANVEFVQADAMDWAWPVERFDCIVSIATLHHLPLEQMLERMKRALCPGGRLAVLDLCTSSTLAGCLAVGAVSMPASLLLRLFHERRLLRDPEVRRVWREHGAHDHYLTLDQVRQASARVLPGAVVHRRLLWRYSMIWRRPCET